jgi:uncharacterized protein
VTPADLVTELRLHGSLTLTLKVIPKSSRDEIVGILTDRTLKVKITAAPDKGKANAAVCGFLADFFDVPKSNVRIVRGATSHTKQVTIHV